MKKKDNIGTLFTVPMIISVIVLSIIVIGVVIGPYLVQYDPNAVDIMAMLNKPSSTHWLGTDGIGRDQFTRLLYGGRSTLVNAITAVLISIVIGIPLGLYSGYRGGIVDTVIMRLWDIILSIPALLLAFIFVAAFGRSSFNAVVAIGIVYIPMISKLSRSLAITERTKAYVEACVTFGYSTFRIIFIHILPNCVATLLAEITLDISTAIMSLASLSFLGLGVQMPDSDWGTMLQEGMAIILKAPYLIISPAIVIILSSVSLNIISDGIQMYLDPDQRKLPSFKKYRSKMTKIETALLEE